MAHNKITKISPLQGIDKKKVISFLIVIALAYFLGKSIVRAGDPILISLMLFAFTLTSAIVYRLEIGVYLSVFVLMNLTSSIFINTNTITIGPISLPGPLAFITVCTIALAITFRIVNRRPINFLEPRWMIPLMIIMALFVLFFMNDHGVRGANVWRLQALLRGVAFYLLVVLVLENPGQIYRLIRILSISYLFFSLAYIYVSIGGGYGYQSLESEYTTNISAHGAIGALINLFIPICIGAFIVETKWIWRTMFMLSLLSNILFCVLTFSRSGALGLFVSFAAWMILGLRYFSRKMVVGIGMGIAVVLVFNVMFRLDISDSLLRDANYLQYMYARTERDLLSNSDSARKYLYLNAWQTIKENPLSGIGAGNQPSHSLFLGAGLDGGIFFMGIWLIIFAVLIMRSYRLWRSMISDPVWGPITLGLFISMAYSFINNWYDMILYSIQYGLIFWLLRGIESVLINARKYKT
ncbi:MAG: O-antigen ligase family protein [Candidatus Scalindua sp.]